MKCNNCGGVNPDESKFCMHCGGKIEMELSCSKCGFKSFPPEALFCPACGIQLNDNKSWDQLRIGDYYYSDGTFSSQMDETKNCVGIVFTLETTDEEKKHGWTHGQIVALEDAGNGGDGELYKWGPKRILPSPHVVRINWTEARQDKDGFLYSNSVLVSENEYEAFRAAKKHSIELPVGQASGWYLPSVGQWVEIIENLGKISIISNKEYVNFDGNREHWNNKLSFLKLSALWYWTSLQRNIDTCWTVNFRYGSFNNSGCLYINRVRLVSAI